MRKNEDKNPPSNYEKLAQDWGMSFLQTPEHDTSQKLFYVLAIYSHYHRTA